MTYAKIYERLIERRRAYPLSKSECYCERHHYIPRCMGGGNESWNIINVTAKEHFIAHHLLCKINPNNIKLLNAFMAMCTKTTRQKRQIYISAKRYEQLKCEYGRMRRKWFAEMTEESRHRRQQNIKAACAKRTPEQKARIKAKRMAYFAALKEDEKERIAAKRRLTIESRTEEENRSIFERISKAHRKLSEEDEQRVISEYKNGKTALEISLEPWCELSREGVNYLLRRHGVETHAKRRWNGKAKQICTDFTNHKYPTRDALAKAYGTSWSTIQKILIDNGIKVTINGNRQKASIMRQMQKLMAEHVSCQAPFSRVCTTNISLYNAICRLRMFGLISPLETQRNILKKIRHALRGETKYAYGYEWKSCSRYKTR